MGLCSRALEIVTSYCAYLWYWALGEPTLDYVSMGLGIRARNRSFKREWRSHLQLSQHMIRSVIDARVREHSEQKPLRIAVLGAGCLIDFPCSVLDDVRLSIDLYDYDPVAIEHLKRRKTVRRAVANVVHADVTGVVEEWTRALCSAKALESPESFLRILKVLLEKKEERFTLSSHYHIVISLNIYSQLSLYLVDRITNKINRDASHWRRDCSPLIKQGISKLEHSMREHHYTILNQSGADTVIFLRDTHWISETVSGDIEIEDLHTRGITLSQYNQESRANWEWCLIPRSGSSPSMEVIHLVEATHYSLRARTEAPTSAA